MLNIESWDSRRDYIIPGNLEETIAFAAEHWIHLAKRAILRRGKFVVALSGGSTPKAIFERLANIPFSDWDKVFLFWSDERAVPPDHPESNYRMAMESGFQKFPIPQSQIFRMHAEKEIEKNAKDYEEKIKHQGFFDLVMLGVGEDGHTASLFPGTKALEIEDRLVAANYVSEKKSWRMTLTFPCIEQSFIAVIYALGKLKQTIVPKVLDAAIKSSYPASRIGTPERKALWVLDSSIKNFLEPNK